MHRTASVAIAATLAMSVAFGLPLPAAAMPHTEPLPAALLAGEPITWAVEASNADNTDARESLAYSVAPGTQIRDYIAISNLGPIATTFDVYATDAINDADTGAFGLLERAQEPTDLGAWITVASSQVTIEPGKAAVVPVELLIPSDATPGDHTAGIVASTTVQGSGEDGQAITLEQRVAVRVYLRISGEVVPEVDVTGLSSSFTPPWNPFAGGEASVVYSVANTGNARVDVEQRVVVRGPFGIVLAVLPGEPVLNLLPGQAKRVSAGTAGVLPVGLLFTTVELTPGAPTDRVAQSAEQDAAGAPVEPRPEYEYEAVSEESLSLAVSWTLLALIVLLVAGIWFVARYISVTRDRLYEAIDAADAARSVETAPQREPVAR